MHANEEYVDMKKAGIVDPTKVTRTCTSKCSKYSINGTYNRKYSNG